MHSSLVPTPPEPRGDQAFHARDLNADADIYERLPELQKVGGMIGMSWALNYSTRGDPEPWAEQFSILVPRAAA